MISSRCLTEIRSIVGLEYSLFLSSWNKKANMDLMDSPLIKKATFQIKKALRGKNGYCALLLRKKSELKKEV